MSLFHQVCGGLVRPNCLRTADGSTDFGAVLVCQKCNTTVARSECNGTYSDADEVYADNFYRAPAGDVAGTKSGAVVVAIQGIKVSPARPSGLDCLMYNSSSGMWQPSGDNTPSSATYFLDDSASDIATYKRLITSYPASVETYLSATGNASSGDVLIGAFATDLGHPSLTLVPAGQWIPSLFVSVDSIAQNPSLVIKGYVRHLDGSEILVNTQVVLLTSTAITFYDPSVELPALPILPTDRAVLKFYLRASGPSPRTIKLYYDGTVNNSHIHAPSNYVNSDAVNWVPAPSAVDSIGQPGDAAYDSGFLYICVALNSWKRTALVTWP